MKVEWDPLRAENRFFLMTEIVDFFDGVLMADLRRTLDLTDGNLITHMRILEKSGYITILKGGYGRSAKTKIFATENGRKWLGEYADFLIQKTTRIKKAEECYGQSKI